MLIMTAGYYGKSTDRDRLRLLSDLSKDGVSLLGISKAAEEIGFKTVGGRLGFETLAEEAPLLASSIGTKIISLLSIR